MNIADARKKLPELAGLNDQDALDVIHKVYYPNENKDALGQFLGIEPPPAPEPAQAGVLRTAGDIGIKLAQGAVGLGQAAVGAGSLLTGGLLGKGMREIGYDPQRTKEELGAYLSDSQKASDAKVAAADGFVDTVATSLANPRAILGGIAESAPGMLGGMGVARAVGGKIATRAALATTEGAAASAAELAAGRSAAQAAEAALATKAGKAAADKAVEAAGTRLMALGSATEGLQTAGQIADDAQAAGRNYTDYALPALAAGAGTAIIGMGAGKVLGDSATQIATGAHSAGVRGSAAARIGKEMLSEGVLEEMPQSAQEQVWTNAAMGEADLSKGVGNAAGAGLVTGAVMGGGLGALQGHAPAPAAQPVELPNTGPLSQAANAGQAAAAAQANAMAPQAPAAPQQSLADIDARMAALVAIGTGSLARRERDAAGNPVTIPAVPGRRLTKEEIDEYNQLMQARKERTTLTPHEQAEFDALLAAEQAPHNAKAAQAAAAAAQHQAQIEDAQLADMVAADERARQAAEAQQLADAVASTDARVAAGDARRAAQNRADLRTGIINDGAIPVADRKQAFGQLLAAQGYHDTALTADDHADFDQAAEPLASAPNELQDAVPERATTPPGNAAPNLRAVDDAIAAGMVLKSPNGKVLHKRGSSKVFTLSSAQKAYYLEAVQRAEQAGQAAAALPATQQDETAAADAPVTGPVTAETEAAPAAALAAEASAPAGPRAADDSLYQEARSHVLATRNPSSRDLQLHFKIGYNHAQRLLEGLQAEGIVSPMASNGARTMTAPDSDVDAAAHAAATSPRNDLPEPSEAQKEAGNYQKGHVRLHGLDIAIENPVGSVRRGVDRDGTPWENTMASHYGYIKGTVGADKDHVDVFVGPHPERTSVYVVDQVHPDTRKFDEHKVMLGFDSPDAAQAAYSANYAPDWTGGDTLSVTDIDGLKAWLGSGKTKQPFAKQAAPDNVHRFADLRTAAPEAALATAAAPADAPAKPTKQQLNRKTVKDMSDAELLEARSAFAGGPRAAKVDKEIAARKLDAVPDAAPAEASESGALANATAPEHVQMGVDDRELGEIVAEFNEVQADMMDDGELLSTIFEPPAKRDIVRLADKAKGKLWSPAEVKAYNKQLAERDALVDAGAPVPAELAKAIADFEAVYLPHIAKLQDEARLEIGSWKERAQAQGLDPATRRANGRKIILSLFDLSGEWSRPWEEAGYQVYRFDIQDDSTYIDPATGEEKKVGDVHNMSHEFFADLFGHFDGNDVYGILAACPCTDFAVSGARHFAAKDADGRTVASVKLVHQTLAAIEYFKPAIWAVENPVGRIESLGGLPPWRLAFDPNHLGDSYTKKTLIWGRFNADLPVAPVEPTEGSKMHRLYGGKSMATKNARSVTPEGFSYGFFMANNAVDHPVMALANTYDRLDRDLIAEALAAGVQEGTIREAIDDPYYFDLDDEAAHEAIRALIRAQAPEPDPAPTTPRGKQRTTRSGDAAAPASAPAAERNAPAPVENVGKLPDTDHLSEGQDHDSTDSRRAPALDQALADREQPGSADAAAGSVRPARTGDGRADDGGLREPGGRAEGADDGQQDLGHAAGDGAVSDRSHDPVAGSDERVPARDFRPDAGALTREGSWYDTAARNLDLIELARRIEAGGHTATPAEQAQLAKYTGFGAGEIRNKLFPVPSEYAKRAEPERLIWSSIVTDARWRALAERMEALPRDWQKSVLQSSQYAHYTSESLVRSTWSALQRMGFTGGKIFEPGMGIGNFNILMPASVHATSRYTGVEFDGPTASIARLLSPEQNILHDDFIKRKFPRDYFDVAIGNPPFSQTKVFADPAYEKHGFMLHDFFFAKSIDSVRPGGLLAFVTSKGTMDKQNDRARKYLAERADLLGAIRLPSTAFEANAGTSVVTDVIFLRKRTPGQQPAGEAWGKVATVATKDGDVVVNEYFAAHPDMVLGQQRISGNTDDQGRRINGNGAFGPQYTVVSYDATPAELDAKFAAAVERLPAKVYSPLAQSAESVVRETAKVDFDPSVKRDGVVYVADDGTIMRVEGGVGRPLAESAKLSAADVAWFKGYVGLRDLVNEARLTQTNDGPWEASLKRLNKAYDAFRKEHGPINAYRVQVRKSTDEDGKPVETQSRIFTNRRRYREDYDAAILTQLETINEAGDIVKAPFLLGRTIGVPVTREVKSIGDALAVSLDAHGTLDLDDVAGRMQLSRAEAIEALGDQVFQTPAGQWQLADEYLSGDVVAKLEEAEQAARLDPSLRRNVDALIQAQPEKLGPSQISAKLGAAWIPVAHVNAFAAEIEAGAVSFDPKTETWQVDGGNLRTGRRAGAEYGTEKRSPSELLEAVLNSRPIKVTMTTVDKKTVTDVEATTSANEAAKKIKDKFKGWVWTDTERAAELVELYNKRYNNIAPRRFDGSHLTLPGVSLRYSLHPHQKNGIWRVIQTGDTYLAHAVGAGKTMEMIAAGMEQKRLGLIKKPMYVVPNHMLEQFSNEFMELYPLANIMVADDENFSAERRKAFIASATLNNPDAVIITHDAFQRIGVKESSVAPIRDEILLDLELELSDTAKGGDTRVRRSQLEQQIEAVTQRFDRIIAAGDKDSTLKFEDIGVDFIFADEAHVYRKLDFHTAQQIKGIDPNGSKRALDMYVKTRYLQSQRPGRAMVFASGTPITNTMGELYTIMRFFVPQELDRAGIATFDSWARMFGEVAPALEPNAAGKYELVERFAKFDNVPELMARVRQFMDVLTSEHLGALIKRPDLIGGKPHLNVVEPTEELRVYMASQLGPRIERSKRWKPTKDQPSNPDPIVAIITDGRFAALDPRFFGGALDDGEQSVITTMAGKVVNTYHATSDNVYLDKNGQPEPLKGSTQMVFYNLGFGEQSQAARGFNARAAFTKQLVAGGIPRAQIAWFDDANTDAKKETVFKGMRSGKIRVLVGSAKKMGTGVNAQKRLIQLHYQDPPWYPSDVEQPHGRIIRQGNQNGEVGIEWYTTKGTYQSTMWQMVARKQRFIDQAFTGDKSVRSMEDLGEASLFEQAAAVASGDPRALQLAGLKQDVNRLERLQAAHANEQIAVRNAMNSALWSQESSTRAIATYSAAYQVLGERHYAFTTGTVQGQPYDKPGEFGQAVKDAFNAAAARAEKARKVLEDVPLADLGIGLTLTMDSVVDNKGKPTGDHELNINIGGLSIGLTNADRLGEGVDAAGLARRIVNVFNGVETKLRGARAELATAETDLVRLRKKRGAPFEHQQELAEKYGDLQRLEEELRLEGAAAAKAAAEQLAAQDAAAAGAVPMPPEADPAKDGEDSDAIAFSRARIDTDDLLVNIYSQIAQDDAAFRLPDSDGRTLAAVVNDMAPGILVDGDVDIDLTTADGPNADRVWRLRRGDGADGDALVFRNTANKQVWLNISNWKEGRSGHRIYQAVATWAHNTGHVFIGDPDGLSDKALYRRTEQMLSSALRHGSTEHLAPHARQVEDTHTRADAPMRPIHWREGNDARNLREMLVSSYTNISAIFPEIARVHYNFATGQFERVPAPVRAPERDVLAHASAGGEQVAAAGDGPGAGGSAAGRGIARADEADGQLARMDAVPFTDEDFKALVREVRAAYEQFYPSSRGAYTPPIGVSDLKRAALTGTVLRAEGSDAGRAVLDHVAERLLQRVSVPLESLLYSRDAAYFRHDDTFAPQPVAQGATTGDAAPAQLAGHEYLQALRDTEQLNRRLAKEGQEPVKALRQAPNAQFALARQIGKALGIRVQFVSSNGQFEGVATGGVAYLANSNRQPELAIAGHETLHALEQSNPGLGERLRAQIRAYLSTGVVEDRQAREYVASGFQEVSERQAESEVLADINGAMWMDPRFWAELAKADRSLFRSVAYKFMEVATRMLDALRRGRFDVSRLVSDVEAVRAIMVATWAEHNAQRDAAAAQKRAKTASGALRFAIGGESVPLPRSEWLRTTAIAQEVENRIGNFAHQPPVRILNSLSDLDRTAAPSGVQGAVQDGVIYLFRDQLRSLGDVQRVLFHELLHYGLERFLTKEQYITHMHQLYERDAALRGWADAWLSTPKGQRDIEAHGRDFALAVAIDEGLAQIAQGSAGAFQKNGITDRTYRTVLRWMGRLAEAIGMRKTAAYLRGRKNEEARALIRSAFAKLEQDAPPADPWQESGRGFAGARYSQAAAQAPEQIKSATGNSGTFDAGNADIAFSRVGLGEALANAAGRIEQVKLPAGYLVGDLFNQSGKLSWWHKTIGTMDNLARRQPLFAPVYEAVQAFLGDVSRFAVVAADKAPTLLPKLETLGDAFGKHRKQALSAADTKAISAPIFEGTLVWARNAHGKPVKLSELEAWAEGLNSTQKADILLQKGVIDHETNQAWLHSRLDHYDESIARRFRATQLQAGVVWSDAELQAMFQLDARQIGLYREFRAALDQSLTNLTISEMVKLGGEPAKGLLEQAVAAPNLSAAAQLLRDHFVDLAQKEPGKQDMHLDTARQIMDLSDRGQDLMDRGYAPLSRFGKHTVYVQQGGEQVYFGMFETAHEASRMARQMQAEHPDADVSQGTVSEDAYKLFAGIAPETIELFGSMIGLDSQGEGASSEVYQSYLKLAKNNRSAMKRMIERKGIAGFSEDAARVLASFIYSNARLTSGNAHLGEIDKAVTEIPKQEGELTDAAMQLRETIRNSEGGNRLGGLMFAQFLGGSVASALVNLTQPITMTLPFLSQYGGIGKAGQRLAAAMRDAAKRSTGDAKLDAALQWAADEGIVAPQEVHYLQAQAAGKGALRSGDGSRVGNARATLNNALAKVQLGWGKLFAMAEQANRRITFIAAYRTAQDEGHSDPARFAQDAVTQTQGTYNSGNRPKWARNPVGGVLMTFKQYSIGYLELLTRMAFAGRPGSPERAAGRRAALYMVAVLFLMAGTDGLPFEQDLEDALDGILQRLGYNFSTKRAKQEFLTGVLGEGGADFVLKGVSSLPGMPVDVAGRFGMGNLIPGTGLLTKKESYAQDLGELVGPAGDLAKRTFTAAGKALGGDVAGAALDLSPAAVRNVAKGADMLASGHYADGRGYKVNDTTAPEGVLKMLGFQPNSTANIQDAKGQALNMIAQTRMRSQEIQEHWARGILEGDQAMIAEARASRDDWNAKNPEAPVRVNMAGIVKRVRNMRQDVLNRTQKTAPAALKASVRAELAETRA